MPVDNDINILLDGRLDDWSHTLHGIGWVLKIVVFDENAHGSTHHGTVPVLLQRLYYFLVVETRPQVMPAQADTAQNDGVTPLIAKLGSLDLQLSVLLHWFVGG